jgi:hypothetical protein
MTQPRAMTPDDLTRIRFVSDPQLSPDGSRIASPSAASRAHVAHLLSPHAGEFVS